MPSSERALRESAKYAHVIVITGNFNKMRETHYCKVMYLVTLCHRCICVIVAVELLVKEFIQGNNATVPFSAGFEG